VLSSGRRRNAAIAGALALSAACALLAARAWITAAHPVPAWGAAGDPGTLLALKLDGWITGLLRFPAAALLWEWLPAILFGVGLWLLLGNGARRLKLPRLLPAVIVAGASALVLAAGSFAALGCFNGIPHVQDAIAYDFQARVFASGRLWAPAPGHPEFFRTDFLVDEGGRWYAQYPPGQSTLLALGVLARAPWVVNPLLCALSAVFVYLAAAEVYGRRTAFLALGFFSLSPFVWFMAGERMSHPGTLFWLSAALAAFAPALAGKPRPFPGWRALAGGVLLGLAVSTRPLCGAAVALPLLLGALAGHKPAARALAAALGAAVGALPLLAFNAATTGLPWRFGYEALWGTSGWGFGQSQWGPPHTPAEGFRHLLHNWDAAAKYLYEWPVPSLLPLLGLVFLPRLERMDRVLIGTLAALSLAYVPYFFQDHCLGPRFLFAGMPAFVILSARGLPRLGMTLARRRGLALRSGLRAAVIAAGLCTVVGIAANLPALLAWYGRDFWGVGPGVDRAVRARGLRNAVVLIRDHPHARKQELVLRGVSRRTAQGAVELLDSRWTDRQTAAAASLAELEARLEAAMNDPRRSHFRHGPIWRDARGPAACARAGLALNTPWPERQAVIYATDLGARNRLLLQDFPGRKPWLYTGEGRLVPMPPHSP
jgi:4-amino-4-deoxy-L-arabinose transferase-like glycosyltransferase